MTDFCVDCKNAIEKKWFKESRELINQVNYYHQIVFTDLESIKELEQFGA